MIGKAYTAADHGLIADNNTSRNTAKCGHNAKSAKSHIVRNLHQIIDLGALTDHRVVQSAAVNRGVGTNFNIILKDYAAELRYFSRPLGPGT